MAVTAAAARHLFPWPPSVMLLVAVALVAGAANPATEACGLASAGTDASSCSNAPLQEASPSSSSVLLQRRSSVNMDAAPASEQNSKPPQGPAAVTNSEEGVQKFLAGVPVYNYGYVKRLEECEKVGGLNCRRGGLLQLGNGAGGPGKDWEKDFLHNDDHLDGDADSHDDHGHYDPPTPVEDLRSKDGKRGRVREWLVKMRDGVSDQVLSSFCDDVRLSGNAKCTAQGHPSKGGIPLVIVRGTEEELEEQLWRHQGKSDYVEPDIPMDAIPEVRSKEEEDLGSYGEPSQGTNDTYTEDPYSWGLDRIDDRHGLDGSYDIALEGGEGVHVYIADTGIRTTHQDFHGRAVPTLEIRRGILRECERWNNHCAQDESGHGTHAAATLGGRRYGVAKSSTLHSIKILSKMGRGKMSYLIQALDWVATKGKRPAVFMASVGGRGNPPSILKAIEAASSAGVTVVVAAGNYGLDACEFSPAHVKAAITVGATENSADKVASYSNYGPCVDLYAPGSDIHSAGGMSDTAKATMSGSSMSTPHVAGAAALLLGEDATRTPEEVAMLLKARATQSDAKDMALPGGLASMMLYTAELDETDEIWWQSTWTPSFSKFFDSSRWFDFLRPGPMKELMAEGFVCCLFLITLAFMMTQCIRFFSLPPDAYERG